MVIGVNKIGGIFKVSSRLGSVATTLLILICASSGAWAEKKLPHRPQGAELRALPKPCQLRFGKDPGQFFRVWEERMGKENAIHFHHYCQGLTDLNRALTAGSDKRGKKYYLNGSIGNFNYVLRRWKPTFPYYSRAKMYKMQAESMLRSLRY